MNKTSYYTVWAGLFILCAGLGFIPEPAGFLKAMLILLTLGFFAVPVCFVNYLQKRGDVLHIKIVRNLSIASLGLTVVLILVNFMSMLASEAVGNALYVLLVIVSAPMVCGQYWVLSLFLWACLLFWTQSVLKKK